MLDMPDVQTKIRALSSTERKKPHAGYRAARWIISVLYSLALLGSLFAALDRNSSSLSFPVAALALTLSYGILVLLLWLHERFPASQEKPN